MTLTIWQGEKHIRSYASPMAPRVGDVLVMERGAGVRVTGVILSFEHNERGHELGNVDVYVVPDPNPGFTP